MNPAKSEKPEISVLRLFFEKSAAGIYLTNGKVFVYVNDAMAEIFGYKASEIMGKLGPMDLVHPEDRDAVMESLKKRLKGEIESARFRFRGVRKDGKTVWYEVFTRRVVLDGKPYVIGTIVDVTEHVNLEKELKESEEYYRALFESSHDGIFIMECEKFTDCNRVAVEMFGCESKDELIGKTPWDFSPEIQPDGRASKEKASELIKLALSGRPLRFYWKHVRKDGTTFDADVSLVRVKLEGAAKLQTTIRDISERVAAEEKLKESEERYRDLIENSNLSVVVLDENGRMVFANENFLKAFSYTWGDLAGRYFVDIVHPDDREMLMEHHRIGKYKSIEDIPKKYEIKIVGGNNKIHYVEVDVSRVAKQGKLTGYRLYMEDVTEMRKLREQLLFSQRMESVGRLAGGIAHDFNNLLTVIIGRCELIMSKIEPESPIYRDLESIKKAAEKGASLTKDLLTFSRKASIKQTIVNLNSVIKDMEDLLRRAIGENVELKIVLEKDIWSIMADPSRIGQILMNLILNAKEAMPNGGVITVSTQNKLIKEKNKEKYPGVEPGHYVSLTVEDTGCGMTEEVMSHIFEPFFTTKKNGTGLGLSTVYGIVKQLGGYIFCSSEINRGTRFEILFPRAEGIRRPKESEKMELKENQATIMVLEDEESVREIISLMLESSGYRALEAESGEEALKILKSKKVDLVVTDVVIPGMSGVEFAKKAKSMLPDLKILFISGYPKELKKLEFKNSNFLQKPFSKDELIGKIRETMGK